MTTIQNTQDLLNFLMTQANSGQKNWFGFKEQKLFGIDIAYKMAVTHGDRMTPDEIVDYVIELNNTIYSKMIKG